MGFQTTVNFTTSWGVPGTIFGTTPQAVYPYILQSPVQTGNIFGLAYTFITGTNTVQYGNPTTTAPFAGYMVDPNNFALQGDGTNALNPAFYLPNTTVSSFLREGEIIVQFASATTANIGDNIWFSNTTGQLIALPYGTTSSVGNSWGFAEIIREPLTASLYGIIRVSPSLVPITS